MTDNNTRDEHVYAYTLAVMALPASRPSHVSPAFDSHTPQRASALQCDMLHNYILRPFFWLLLIGRNITLFRGMQASAVMCAKEARLLVLIHDHANCWAALPSILMRECTVRYFPECLNTVVYLTLNTYVQHRLRWVVLDYALTLANGYLDCFPPSLR